MSIFDELKAKTEGLKDKATDLVGGNADKLKDAVGNIGNFVDQKTGGKYSDQVDNLQEKAAGLIDKAKTGNDGGQAPSA